MDYHFLLSLIVLTCFGLINTQFTCPPYQVGVQLYGNGLGGTNGDGRYQAASLQQCCYNCLSIFNTTCAGYTYNTQNAVCYLASVIYFTQYGVSPGKSFEKKIFIFLGKSFN